MTLHWVDVNRARPWVPPALDIQPVLPGKTLGCVLIAAYESGSMLEYRELIVIPALVRHGDHIGAWISHIYVDNADSVTGGREIWGLPKELADFTWVAGSVDIVQGGHSLCRAETKSHWISLPHFWRPPLKGPVFCQRGSELALFKCRFQGQSHAANTHLVVPVGSPFGGLRLDQPWLAIAITNLNLMVEAPYRLNLIPTEGASR